MSRYTPKRLPLAQGGGPARPKKPFVKSKPGAKSASGKAASKTPAKTFVKPGKFACPTCEKRFNTEEALATHAADAHGIPVDLSKMSPLPPSQVRCPICAAPLRKRNLGQHLRFIHETV